MVREIDARSLAQALAQGRRWRLVDVRQSWENQVACLPNSLLIPLSELPRRADELAADRDQPLVVYCHHGVRSRSAAAFLERLGFAQVYSLQGGIDAWSCDVDPSVPRY